MNHCTNHASGNTREPSWLPPMDGGLFLTDGGIETVLIYQDGIELTEFAAFVLLETDQGREQLRRYYRRYLDLATRTRGAGFVLESPTWRASLGWGAKLGFDAEAMGRINRNAAFLMHELRNEYASRIDGPIVVSGCIGPRGDGYVANQATAEEAERAAHQPQADALAAAGVDVISAITMTSSTEAIGVARAAARVNKPAVISFTVETDGRLPSGEFLHTAIGRVDEDAHARGQPAPAYYMLNCAHPSHFEATLAGSSGWQHRILGLRANASSRSHAELDAMTTLDRGDPTDLGRRYRKLREQLPRLGIVGGCCGTDHDHVAEIIASWNAA